MQEQRGLRAAPDDGELALSERVAQLNPFAWRCSAEVGSVDEHHRITAVNILDILVDVELMVESLVALAQFLGQRKPPAGDFDARDVNQEEIDQLLNLALVCV
jgi:hypothetical protein